MEITFRCRVALGKLLNGADSTLHSVHNGLLQTSAQSLQVLLQLQMQSLAPAVVRQQLGLASELGVDQRLDPVGHVVVGMENMVEAPTGGETEVAPQFLCASDRQEQTDWRSDAEQVIRLKV